MFGTGFKEPNDRELGVTGKYEMTEKITDNESGDRVALMLEEMIGSGKK